MKNNYKKLGNAMLKDNIKTFSSKYWKDQDNKKLLKLIGDHRLNLAPATLYKFDQLGLNHLEILSLSHCLGKKIHTLPSADLDLLNLIEDKTGICFGYDKKITNKYHLAKVDHFCSGFNSEGYYPTLSSALFTLDLYI